MQALFRTHNGCHWHVVCWQPTHLLLLLTKCLPLRRRTTPRLAQVLRQPDDALLALLLGNAMGVMLLLSVWEM